MSEWDKNPLERQIHVIVGGNIRDIIGKHSKRETRHIARGAITGLSESLLDLFKKDPDQMAFLYMEFERALDKILSSNKLIEPAPTPKLEEDVLTTQKMHALAKENARLKAMLELKDE